MQDSSGPSHGGASALPQRPHAHAAEDPLAPPPAGAPPPRTSRRRRRAPRALRLGATLLVLVVVLVLGWGAGLALWSDSRIEHVDALSGAENTPGTTYLIAGSDQRDGEAVAADGTEGARTDTIMLLHKAPGGNSYLVSLPRDLLVDIPGHGGYKLNAAYAFGGASLLVETVEQFTGLSVDHYVEVGFDGVAQVVDAVDHVNLCIDQDVDDERSGLTMTEGCHDVGGDQALAFVRARYFDPTADIGRQQRQQEFIGSLMDRVTSPGVLLNPLSQIRLAGAGSGALTTSEGTGIIDVGRMGLTARSAMNSGGTLSIPVENPEFQTRHSGVAIQTDDAEIAAFFAAIGDGSAELAADG
ncbi:MAG: LCP family protein [Actinomycetales bacterium]|nr:LCP family protein [Actinomycetales bacterium]